MRCVLDVALVGRNNQNAAQFSALTDKEAFPYRACPAELGIILNELPVSFHVGPEIIIVHFAERNCLDDLIGCSASKRCGTCKSAAKRRKLTKIALFSVSISLSSGKRKRRTAKAVRRKAQSSFCHQTNPTILRERRDGEYVFTKVNTFA